MLSGSAFIPETAGSIRVLDALHSYVQSGGKRARHRKQAGQPGLCNSLGRHFRTVIPKLSRALGKFSNNVALQSCQDEPWRQVAFQGAVLYPQPDHRGRGEATQRLKCTTQPPPKEGTSWGRA